MGRWVELAVVAIASAGVGSGVTATVLRTDEPVPQTVGTPALQASAGQTECGRAFHDLRLLWKERIVLTYAPVDNLRNGQTENHYLDVFRKASGRLDAIEVELDAMQVPEPLRAIHDLEREFVNILRTTYDAAIEGINDADPQATNTVQTGHTRAAEVYTAVQRQLRGFAAESCAAPSD